MDEPPLFSKSLDDLLPPAPDPGTGAQRSRPASASATGPPFSDHHPQRRKARQSLVLPILSWLSQLVVASDLVRNPLSNLPNAAAVLVYLTIAGVQAVLILAGLFLGISALHGREPGERGVSLPAFLGILVSAGTIVVIGLAMAGAFR